MKKALFLFALTFSYYLYGLAPTVTLEDSGELVTAAFHLGVPHPPGYPLYTMIAHLFTYLPVGDIAYRVNFMSAFFSALAIVALYFVTQEALRIWGRRDEWIALLVCLLIAVTPHYFRQSVIAEVYGLNNFLCAILLFLSLRWWNLFQEKRTREEKRTFYLYAFFCGVALTNHHTTWVFALAGVVLAAMVLKRQLLARVPLVFVMVGLGLLPYLYLPLASLSDPILDWGNPQTWSSFLDVVFRRQYEPTIWRSSFQMTEQLREQVILLLGQLPLPLLFVGVLGVCFSFSYVPMGIFFVLLLVLTGPLTSALVNYRFQFFNGFLHENTHGLLSVFFLVHYMIWAILIVLGCRFLLGNRKWAHRAVVVVLVGLVLYTATRTFQQESKRDYRYAVQLKDNILKLTGDQRSIILTRWDPFSFPFFYFQWVQGEAKSLIVIDVEMLKAPWYLQALQRWYPDFYQQVSIEMDGLSKELELFFSENGSGDAVMEKYHQLMDQIVAKHIESTPIYLAHYRGHSGFPLKRKEHYRVHSQIVLGRLTQSDELPGVPGIEEFDFSNLPPKTNDQLAGMLASYYSGLLIDRGRSVEKQKNEVAREYFHKAKVLGQKDVVILNWLKKKLEPETLER